MRKSIDLIGHEFGRLTVISIVGKDKWGGILWKCDCSCGNFIDVNGSRLRSGNTKSCGCLKKEISRISGYGKKVDITGSKFGKLTVTSEIGRDKNKQVLWNCICDCGKTRISAGGELRRGKITSCGCDNHQNKKWFSQKEMYDAPSSGHSVFFNRIPKVDAPEVIDGLVSVSCKLCKKHFFPSYGQIISRVASFEGRMAGESNFYCSDDCKNSCSTYRVQTNHMDPRLRKQKSEKSKTRACQTKTLKQLQCYHNNGQSYCEKCGDFIDVELHHTLPVAKFASEAINPAGHMLLCAGCHVELHRVCA